MASFESMSGSLTNSYSSFYAPSDSANNMMHSRLPSSSSSLSSSPSRLDPSEWLNTPLHKRKHSARSSLPNVAEHPAERINLNDSGYMSRSLDYGARWTHSSLSRYSFAAEGRRTSSIGSWDPDDFDYDFVQPVPPKKRRSSVNSIAHKFLPRLPSFSKRSRENKTSPLRLRDSRVSVSPGLPSSRSSSRAGSYRARSSERVAIDSPVPRQSFQFETINEDDAASAELLATYPTDEEETADPGEIERKQTPLLPVINTNPSDEAPIQSPLQSPTIAMDTSTSSALNSPSMTPVMSVVHTPSVSKRPSAASFMRNSQQMPDTNVRSSLNEPRSDRWADALGHADYVILPEPYLPEDCSIDAHKQLHADWECARAEFSKHLAKTGHHFGQGSTTYRLTRDKWECIDAEWKDNSEKMLQVLVGSGELAQGHTPIEPAPLAKIPSFDDQGKFPKLGDEDIIGPMTVEPVKAQRTPSQKHKRRSSTKAALMQFFNSFQGTKTRRTS